MRLFNRKSKTTKESTVDYHTYDSVVFKVVGTTFKNKDGESRQDLLRDLYEHRSGFLQKKWPTAILDPYKYKGRSALAVYAEGVQVGNIAEAEVETVSRLLPCVDYKELVINWFEKDQNEKIVFIAEVVLYLRPGSNMDTERRIAPQTRLSSNSNYVVEELKVVGYTSQNPDGEFIQEILGRLVKSRNISISFGEYAKGKSETIYVFANGMIIGSFYKKDKAKLEKLLSLASNVKLEIETTNSGAGFSDYHKPHLKFYLTKNLEDL